MRNQCFSCSFSF